MLNAIQRATSKAASQQFHSSFHKCPCCASFTLYHPPKRQSTKKYFRKLEIAVWQGSLITAQPVVQCVKVMDENSLSAFPPLALATFPIRAETGTAVLTLIGTGLHWRQSHGNGTLCLKYIHMHYYTPSFSFFRVFKIVDELTEQHSDIFPLLHLLLISFLNAI